MEGITPEPGMNVSFVVSLNHRTGKQQAQEIQQAEELFSSATAGAS